MGGRSKRQGAQGSCRPLRTATSIHKNSPSQLSRKWADVSWQWLTLETTMQKGSIWRSLKEGQNTNKIFRNIAWPHKNYVRKTKAHWELIFVKDIKDNMKNFSHPINSKMVNSEAIGTLLDETSDPVTAGADRAEVPSASLASFLIK